MISIRGIVQCSVDTITKFQGLEKRIIIISMVRKNSFGFTKNPKLFNVAVNRAKSLLIVVGNPSLLSQDKCWSNYMDFCITRKGYYGLW